MAMPTTYNFYSDSGHGWAKVPRWVLDELRIAEEITPYSYQRGGDAYLEEDCDLGTFCRAYEKANGNTPRFRTHISERSRIRGYESYTHG